MKDIGYQSIKNDKPFVIREKLRSINFDFEYYRKNYSKLNPDEKYFVDQTSLEPGIGICYFQLWNLVEGNSLNLKPGCYRIQRSYQYPVLEIMVNANFKI